MWRVMIGRLTILRMRFEVVQKVHKFVIAGVFYIIIIARGCSE